MDIFTVLEFAFYLALGWTIGRIYVQYQTRKRMARMAEQMQEILKSNPQMLEGLPLIYIERVQESSGAEVLLVYEELTNKFVTQASSLQELGDRLHDRWPNDPIYVKQGDHYAVIAPDGTLTNNTNKIA